MRIPTPDSGGIRLPASGRGPSDIWGEDVDLHHRKGDSEQSVGEAGGALTAAGFTKHLQESWRALWCVAAGAARDRDRAEDVLQEAALIGWTKRADFQPGTNFKAWMARIVKHVASNERRRVGRRKTSAADPASLDESMGRGVARSATGEPIRMDGGPQGENADEMFDDEVLAALEFIEETARTCLLLRVVQDMPYKEIAQTLEIPEGTAMSHVHRARKALAERLSTTHGGGAGPHTVGKHGRRSESSGHE